MTRTHVDAALLAKLTEGSQIQLVRWAMRLEADTGCTFAVRRCRADGWEQVGPAEWAAVCWRIGRLARAGVDVDEAGLVLKGRAEA
jgi:hypothetical protein